MKMKDGKIINKEVVFDKYGKKMLREDIKVAKDVVLDWYYLDTPLSVMILPITKNKEIVFQKIYRHNLRKSFTELPAGGPDKGDNDILETAKRELLEETGFSSEEWLDIGRYYVLPSETNRWVQIYLALGCEKIKEPQLDTVIEEYFDMSIHLIKLSEYDKSFSIDGSYISGLETQFALDRGIPIALSRE